MELDDKQLDKLTEQIANEIVLRGELGKFFTTSMPDSDLDDLAGRLSGRINSQITFPAVRKVKRGAPIRIRVNDLDVNADENDVAQGHAGPTLPDIINFHGGTGWLETGDARELHLTMGGGTDCMFDWLVSSCYAALVTAGTHVEGQTFTSLTGCTFYVTSLIQTAWDGNSIATGAKNFTSPCTVYICPGGGIGQLAISGDNGQNAYPVIFVGSNLWDSYIESSGSTWAVDISGDGTSDKFLIFKDLGFGDLTGTSDRPFRKTAGAQGLVFYTCRFGNAGSIGPTFSGGIGGIEAHDCEFPADQAGNFSLDLNGYGSEVHLYDCSYNNTVRIGTETHFYGGQCTEGAGNIGIRADNTAGGIQLHADGVHFDGSAADFTSYFSLDSVSLEFTIEGCTALAGVDATTAAILIGPNHNADAGMQHVVGNSWDCDNGIVQTFDAINDKPLLLNYSGNTHRGADANPVLVNALIATGSVFGNNVPNTGVITPVAGSGIFTVDGMQRASGAPTHIANYAVLYTDTATDTIYYQTVDPSGSTWAIIGVSGGGAAAPSPHDFVGTHHTGDDDYTQTPNVLGLGVSTGDITTYSDAGITPTAFIDGGTGQIVSGDDLDGATITFGGTPTSARIAARNDGVGNPLGLLFTQHSSTSPTTLGPFVTLAKSRGTYGAQLIVQDNNVLGVIDFLGHDGVDYERAAQIRAEVDGTPGSGDMPGRLEFHTTPDGAASVVERARFTSDGAFRLIGVAAPGTPAADSINVYVEAATDLLKAKDDNAAVYALTHLHVVTGIVDSATASTTVPYVISPPMPHAGVITAVFSRAGSAKTCGATAWVGDIHKILTANANTDTVGTTIFTVKPTITNTNMYQAYGAPDSVTTFAAGDMLAYYTDAAGTNLTDVTMSVHVRYT